jgi:CubicO group peptidase (beta-lactamase class C family)
MANTPVPSSEALSRPADFAQAARALVEAFVEAGLFAGTVLIAAKGETLLRQGFGLVDREWRIPHVPESKFRLGSLTKQFTAAAILQLMEGGRLALDDAIGKHYPSAPATWREVSLLHLLTHTSGIPSYTAIPGFFDAAARLESTPQEIIALMRGRPLLFQPGAQFKYNNGGYVILGHVIELLSGLRYEDYVAKNILLPLGLADTGYDHDDLILPYRARGYRFENGALKNAAYLAMSVPHAAGAIYSSADDLLAWLKALRAGRLVSAASAALMMRDHGHGYGFGFAVQSQFARAHLVHAGGINGFSVVLSHYPDADLSVIVLANIQAAPVQKIARDLAALYFGIAQEAAGEISLDPALLADYVGHYRLDAAKILRVTQDGARLFLEWPGHPKEEAMAQDDHRFSARLGDWSISFEADGVSLATHAILEHNARTWRAPRIEDSFT